MLSIRTQDRMALVPYTKYPISVYGVGIYMTFDNERDNYIQLGKYTTKERALEVLDEIEILLNKDDYEIIDKEYEFTNEQLLEFERSNMAPYKYYQKRVLVSKVYHMPKEVL